MTFEDIAEVLGARARVMEERHDPRSGELARRIRWRESLFDGSAPGKASVQLEFRDLTEWNAAAAEVISVNEGPEIEVAPRQRSAGATKKGRLSVFLEDLTPYRSGRVPQMQLKTTTGKSPGRVSLEVRDGALDESLKSRALEAGYEVGTTPTGTLVISRGHPPPRGPRCRPACVRQIEALEDAARVAQNLCEWWAGLSAFHQRRQNSGFPRHAGGRSSRRGLGPVTLFAPPMLTIRLAAQSRRPRHTRFPTSGNHPTPKRINCGGLTEFRKESVVSLETDHLRVQEGRHPLGTQPPGAGWNGSGRLGALTAPVPFPVSCAARVVDPARES